MSEWSLENRCPSRFGRDDVIGALNLITPESILEALTLVKRGKTCDLSSFLIKTCQFPDSMARTSPTHSALWKTGLNGTTG